MSENAQHNPKEKDTGKESLFIHMSNKAIQSAWQKTSKDRMQEKHMNVNIIQLHLRAKRIKKYKQATIV